MRRGSEGGTAWDSSSATGVELRGRDLRGGSLRKQVAGCAGP